MKRAWKDKKMYIGRQHGAHNEKQMSLQSLEAHGETFGSCCGEREEGINATSAGKTEAYERVETSW